VFFVYLRTNGDFFPIHHKEIGIYNREEKCLQRGTNWVFKCNSLRFVFKRLNCDLVLHSDLEIDRVLSLVSIYFKYCFLSNYY
jgi:hypothetical protein